MRLYSFSFICGFCSGYLPWGQLGLHRIMILQPLILSTSQWHSAWFRIEGWYSRTKTVQECLRMSGPVKSIVLLILETWIRHILAGILNISPFWTTVSSVNKNVVSTNSVIQTWPPKTRPHRPLIEANTGNLQAHTFGGSSLHGYRITPDLQAIFMAI